MNQLTLIPENQFAVKGIQQNDAVGRDFSGEDFFRQFVQNISLNYSFYGSSTKLRIISFLG
jgi:hypothetical protein